MTLFGTDGIRGKAGDEPLTLETVEKIGRAYAPGTIAVGRDTRVTSPEFEEALIAGLRQGGAHVIRYGIVPSAVLAHLIQKNNLDGGVMITASHNPPADNGLKFFGKGGEKISVEQQQTIEQRLEAAASAAQGELKNESADDYLQLYNGTVTASIVLDCAHGAAFEIGPAALRKLGAQVIALNADNDGAQINIGCGAMHPQAMAQRVVSDNADAGFALDGDADRLVVADELGRIWTGDQVLALLAQEAKKVVVTHYSNRALDDYLKGKGIDVIRTSAGDAAVWAAMQEHSADVGGEQSGHFIFSGLVSSGDGTYAAAQILKILQESGKKLSELLPFEPYPQTLTNVHVSRRVPLEQTKLQVRIEQLQKDFTGRIFVRYSGTESMLRIMVEGKNEKDIKELASQIALAAELELG